MAVAYATTSELAAKGGLPAGVLASFSEEKQLDAITTASGLADGYLRSQCTPPLTDVPDDVKFHVCRMAAYFLMRERGFDPERGSDVLIRDDYKDALAWLKSVSRGEITLFGVTDSTPDDTEEVPAVYSAPLRST